ncbi:HAAS signaling domain-containing protein [Metabacillus malikii]|uniref:DUF1700 domain-containing protein n=1 Tax=Metabacillus malikii TaxID=1504265 RepID=A0ABT9ZBL6_9BACI|nr:hypothetical protein [Metabacillus malikii]MDQ0229651.1 hypothetical protein [Metabacillus malikii]
MRNAKADFIQTLEKALPKTVDKREIIREYELHIEEMLLDHPHLSVEDVIRKLGNPIEIAKQYQEIAPMSFVSRHFVVCNFMFFIVGAIFTICYHLYKDSVFSDAWGLLAQIPSTIIIVYTVFWMLLGFEIGKEYGVQGKELFSKTVFISIVPNLLLMLMTVLQLIPTNWFEPILTPTFTTICVIITILFYPISKLFYYIGVHRSI